MATYPAIKQKIVNATGQMVTGSGILHVLQLVAGAAAATVTIYDNTTNSAPIIAIMSCVANDTRNIDYQNLPFGTGLYAVITGAGAQVQVTYE